MTELFESRFYLIDWQTWTEAWMIEQALRTHVDLTPLHELCVSFIRDFYQSYRDFPPQRALIKHLREAHHVPADSFLIQRLFPGGLLPQGALLAGLPKPSRCL